MAAASSSSSFSSSSDYERSLHCDIGYKLLHNYGSRYRQRSRAISFSSASASDELDISRPFNRPRKDAKSSEKRGDFSERGSSRHEFKPWRGRPTRMLENSCLHSSNCHGCLANHLDRLHVNNGQVPLSDRNSRRASVASGDISIISNDVQHGVLDTFSQQAVKNNSMHEVAMHARDRLQEKFRATSHFRNSMQTASITRQVVCYGPSEEYVDCIDQGTNIRNRNSIPGFPREVFVPTVRIRESEDKKLVLEQEECPICLEPFLSGEQMIKLSCFHRYHIVCLSPWLLIHRECPYCRSNVLLNQ